MMISSSSFFKKTTKLSKRRIVHAVDECDSIMNDDDESNEFDATATSKRFNNQTNNRKTKSERWGLAAPTTYKEKQCSRGMTNHNMFMSFSDKGRSMMSSSTPTTNVAVSHVQHHMDNDHPNQTTAAAVIPPKMPSRRSSLLQILLSSSSLLRLNTTSQRSKHHIATSELRNASWQ